MNTIGDFRYVSYLGKKEFNDKDIDGIEINFEEFKIFKTELQKQTSEELLKNYPFLGKRAPVVAAGAEVAQMILEKLEVQSIRVSTRGLRYGVVTQGHL
jgi:exopolyphosphatase/guanosine-5'-triphosphate,3'-diphosphate pyrophosphatase